MSEPAGTVMFTIATSGYLPFVLNLHASLARLGLGESLLVYALDDESHAELNAAGVRSHRFGLADYRATSPFRSEDFARIMACKYGAALEILAANRNALYVDSDIVFLRDPTDELHRRLAGSDADLLMQFETPKNVFNAGFWLARPRPGVVTLFERLGEACRSGGDDQDLLNQWQSEGPGVSIEPLDAELFACGNQFLGGLPVEQGGFSIDRSKRPFPYREAYLLHFNYLIGEETKVRAMAQHGGIFHSLLAARTGGILFRLRRLLDRIRTGR